MGRTPFPLYNDNELIFQEEGYVPVTEEDYRKHNGVCLSTVWSIGCPFKCTYCGNTVFIENDKKYTKLRYPPVDYLVEQIKGVTSKHPWVSTIVFWDDSFMAISKQVLREFADKWKSEIGLPFIVGGVIPSYVNEEKFEILVEAGMSRIRMGIQSGSDRILKFYERPNKPGLILDATNIIAKFNGPMSPPSYDIIVDNPIETRQDLLDTLEMLYEMPRPFTLAIYSLRVIPNSVMEKQLKELNMEVDGIEGKTFQLHYPTLGSMLVYLLEFWKPPRSIFNHMLRFVKSYKEKQMLFPTLLLFIRLLWMCRKGYLQVFTMDFSQMPGWIGWMFWKSGLIKFYRKRLFKSYKAKTVATHPWNGEIRLGESM